MLGLLRSPKVWEAFFRRLRRERCKNTYAFIPRITGKKALNNGFDQPLRNEKVIAKLLHPPALWP